MKKLFWLIAIGLCVVLAHGPVKAESSKIAENSSWPRFLLTGPKVAAELDYLGLKSSESFYLEDIPSEFVIVQVFSMYCPICQREAPRVNQLYQAIDQRDNLKKRLKIVGIGAGNSAYEVDYYRKNYNIAFPLFADGKFKIHKILGEVGTPYFFLLQNTPGGSAKVIFIKEGGFKDPETFLEAILKRSNIN